MKGASAEGSGQRAAGSDAASRRALLVRCNLQIYAARSTHTRAYNIHTPYTHTYIVVMMHNQKLNSVPLAGTRPNGFCLSQKPFPPWMHLSARLPPGLPGCQLQLQLLQCFVLQNFQFAGRPAVAKLEKHHTGHGKCKMVNGESGEETGEWGMEVNRRAAAQLARREQRTERIKPKQA